VKKLADPGQALPGNYVVSCRQVHGMSMYQSFSSFPVRMIRESY